MAGVTAASRADVQVSVYHLNVNDCKTGRPVPAINEDREWMDRLLLQNAVWFCQLRWIVVAVLSGAALASFFPSRLERMGLVISLWWPLTVALVLASLNLVFVRFLRDAGDPIRHLKVNSLLWVQIVSDLLLLTAVVHWLGHELPAAPFMYLFHIILACIVFTPRESLAVTGLAASFYVGMLVLESSGLLAPSSVLHSANALSSDSHPGFGVTSMLLVWAVIWYLVSRLASAFRSRDHDLFLSNRRLTASIEERSQHMLQTTHQLKAPFAAIHAQCQLLLGDYCGALPARARLTVEKMSARCLVLARQIQEMLQLANLRSRGQSSPPTRPVELGALMEEVLTRIEPSARQRGVHLAKEIHAVTVEAVADHLTMLVDNLLVNAVTYSRENGVVHVTCREHDRGALIIIRDEGIGIPREKLPRIFDDYYRTEEAVQHNRGSTGLGLAIVRQVACKDRVPITVESAPGWGTCFTVSLPGHPCSATMPANQN